MAEINYRWSDSEGNPIDIGWSWDAEGNPIDIDWSRTILVPIVAIENVKQLAMDKLDLEVKLDAAIRLLREHQWEFAIDDTTLDLTPEHAETLAHNLLKAVGEATDAQT